MLKNFWYACELSSAVTSKPRLVKVLGQEIAIYRTSAGRAVAMSNLCVHRGGNLSGGAVVDDCLRCPYHGWRFDASGACVSIPSNPHGAPIPKKAQVDAYPTEERYGFIWVFLGDLPEAERPPIPAFPEFGQPGWRATYGEFNWKANYNRVIENGLDFAHGPFVHEQSFGNINEPEVPEHEVFSDDYSATASLTLPASEPKGLWKYLRSKTQKRVAVRLAVHMPNINVIDLRISEKWRLIIFDTNIPVDENNTRTLWISIRNFFTGSWADRNAYDRTMRIFQEDQFTVETQRPELLPEDLVAELPVKSDQLPLAYRRLRKKYMDKGWGLDTGRIADERARQPLVIPSPARRDGSGKTKLWVFPEVPTIEPRQTKAS
jgi:phenylpropionate dioxygenase-like ring-hydroxylating dioxygenase large terminal subunit